MSETTAPTPVQNALDLLDAKQRLFVLEYLVDLNATQAAIRAGYSKKTAGSQAHDLLKKPEIEAAVGEAMRARETRTQISADRVLLELSRIAFFDLRRAFSDTGSLLAPKEWPDDVAACIASVEVVEERKYGKQEKDDERAPDYTKKIRCIDKMGALHLAMQHLGMLKNRIELTGKDGKDLIPSSPTDVAREALFMMELAQREPRSKPTQH